ncbi:hypothetical protein ACFLTY_00235 [Chloroflexota bacterium]
MESALESPHDNAWLGRSWSPFLSFHQVATRGFGPPHQPGLYRLRDANAQKLLLYIGEGTDIRMRMFQLRNAMNKVARGGPQGPPHWAGACILQHEQKGASVEVSWLLDAVPDEGERKGLECEYIAAHRKATGVNPECQFIALNRRKV